MWENVLKNKRLEVQMNPDNKLIRFSFDGSSSVSRTSLELSHSELFELMHAFLSINRSFNRETSYFEQK